MTNVFFHDSFYRIKLWRKLREDLEDKDLETICIEVDKFWQQVPMVSHYLHPDDMCDWPNPWELISDNIFCYYARALGMVYTLMLLGINDIVLMEVKAYNDEDMVLISINDAKYILNFTPNSVVNTKQSDYQIKRYLDVDTLRTKIG